MYISKIVLCVIVQYLTLTVNEDMHLSLQTGWTALMAASQNGQVECVKMLLDMDAEVNMQKKVSGLIIHFVHAMQHTLGVPKIE